MTFMGSYWASESRQILERETEAESPSLSVTWKDANSFIGLLWVQGHNGQRRNSGRVSKGFS